MFDNNQYNGNNNNNYYNNGYNNGYQPQNNQNIENLGQNVFEMNNNFDREYDSRQYNQQQVRTNTYQPQMPYNNNMNFSGEYQQVRYGQSIQNVIFVQPKGFSDIQCSIKSLRENQIVIMNFSRIKNDIIQRILDYLSGAVFALNGSMQRISEALFLLTPKDSKIQIPAEKIKEQFGNK